MEGDKTELRCPECDKVFYKKFCLKRHELTHKVMDNETLECIKCQKKFNRKDNKLRHQAKCTGKVGAMESQCARSPKKFTEERHEQNVSDHKSFECTKCQKKFNRKDNKVRHQVKCNGVNKLMEHQCGKCPKKFGSKFSKERHERICQGAEKEPSAELDCSKCSRNFSRKDYRIQHEKNCQGKLQCRYCKKSFKLKKTFEAHTCRPMKMAIRNAAKKEARKRRVKEKLKVKPEAPDPELKPHACNKCGKKFLTQANMESHQKVCKTKVICLQCNKTFVSTKGLGKHVCGKKKTTRKLKRTYHCRKCPKVFDDRSELYYHFVQKHTQLGDGHHPMPWSEEEAPWMVDGELVDKELKDLYVKYKHLILRKTYAQNNNQINVNWPLANDFTLDQLMGFIEQLYNEQKETFKMNICFGFVLRHKITGQLRYYVAYTNEAVLEAPMAINKRSDLRAIRRELSKLDITQYLQNRRPDSSWEPHMVTNMTCFLTYTGFTLGNAVELPDFLKNKGSLVGLTKSKNGYHEYDDQLCMFRCITYFKEPHTYSDHDQFEDRVSYYYDVFREHCQTEIPEDQEEFEGMEMKMIPEIEKIFEINVQIFQLNEKGVVSPFYRSICNHKETMNLNLWENHVSLIKNLDAFAEKFECRVCKKLLDKKSKWRVHEPKCKSNKRIKYPGSYYNFQKTLFEELAEVGLNVPEEDRYCDYFCVFDLESYLEPLSGDSTQKLEWMERHNAISVSICSNLPGFTEPHCIVKEDGDKMVAEMIDHMNVIQGQYAAIAEKKYGQYLEELETLMDEWKPDEPEKKPKQKKNKKVARIDSDDEDEEPQKKKGDFGQRIKKTMYNIFNRLHSKLEQYMTQLIVVGFNNSRYDNSLIKSSLAKHMEMEEQKHAFVVKNNNQYKCLSNRELKIIDIINFLAPDVNYRKFLKAYEITEQKGFFPYNWFKTEDQLNHDELPEYEDFYSPLKGMNVLEEVDEKDPRTGRQRYEDLKKMWRDKNWTTFEEYLMWYNNLDTGPLVAGIEKMVAHYRDEKIDLLKSAISIPGIARHLLFGSAKDHGATFGLCDEGDKDLHRMFSCNLVGGPSIIYNRHHKVGETYIRNNREKPCQAVFGDDANSLYLWAFTQLFPTGSHVRRHESDGFKPVQSDRHHQMYHFMNWYSQEHNIPISHKMNSGKEKRDERFLADGYAEPTEFLAPGAISGTGSDDILPRGSPKGLIVQYDGCWTHGHSCYLTKTTDPKLLKERAERTEKRNKYYLEQGYDLLVERQCSFLNKKKTNPDIQRIVEEGRPEFYQRHKGCVTTEQLLQAVRNDKIFGALEVDISIPDEWSPEFQHRKLSPKEFFGEQAPLFLTAEIPFDAIGDHMRAHIEQHGLSKKPRQLLVGGLRARKMLISTPLLRYYLKLGLRVTRVHQCVEYGRMKCFQKFVEFVTKRRRAAADAERNGDDSKKVLGDIAKLIGNSGYGSCCMDKTKHTNIKYISGSRQASLFANRPEFRKMTALNEEEEYFELELTKPSITMTLPIQVAFFVLQYAKLLILGYYYNFLDVFLDRSSFELLSMDTDSCYFALSTPDLESAIKPEMKDKYMKAVYGNCHLDEINADFDTIWFPRKCCKKHEWYDNKTPGLFKREAEGREMHALTSKTYLVTTHKENNFKMSCKGVQKHRVKNPYEIFKSVLDTGIARSSTNMGFRARNNTMYTYRQERCAFPYVYCKRVLHSDGRSTSPLDILLEPRDKYAADFNDTPAVATGDVNNGTEHAQDDVDIEIDL